MEKEQRVDGCGLIRISSLTAVRFGLRWTPDPREIRVFCELVKPHILVFINEQKMAMKLEANVQRSLVQSEMERDSMISHGAAEALRDRLCVSSDAYKAVVCEECGDVAITNILEGTNTCRRCGNRAQFGTTTIPHGTQLLIYMLKGMGYNLVRQMKRV